MSGVTDSARPSMECSRPGKTDLEGKLAAMVGKDPAGAVFPAAPPTSKARRASFLIAEDDQVANSAAAGAHRGGRGSPPLRRTAAAEANSVAKPNMEFGALDAGSEASGDDGRSSDAGSEAALAASKVVNEEQR